MLRSRLPTACLCATLSLLASPRPAASLEAVNLTGGFQPDPVAVGYQATGRDAAGTRVLGCPGYVDSTPALVATLSDANARLHLFLVGEGAAGFLVLGPDGIHRCELPDQFGITHARFERIMSGAYMLWPLAADIGATVAGTALVSEIDLGPREVASVTGLEIDPALLPPEPQQARLDPSAEPAFGRVEMPESGAMAVTVGLEGEVPAETFASGCAGAIAPSRPDIVLSLPAPEAVLAISGTASIDTTLMVVTEGGDAYCNDDANNFDPAVVIEDAAAGNYAIWVGTFGASAGDHAVLSFGRDAPVASEPSATGGAPLTLATAAEPAFGRHELPAEGMLEIPVTLTGSVYAGDIGPGCAGDIDPSRPDAVIAVPAPEAELWFRAGSADSDTALIVVGPDGAPLCNDDYDGFNPAVGIPGAAPGDYAVWVGGYGGSGFQASLAVGREPPTGGDSTAGGPEMSPFIGQELESVAAVLAFATETLGLGEILRYERLEETGPEELILHGVVLHDPSGAEEPLQIGRIRISDLDLAGLSAYGAPERFAVSFEEVAYESLAAGARSNMVPLPALEAAPPLSMSVSLLPPDGDATRRELRFGLTLEGQVAVALAARMNWQEGMAAFGPMAALAMSGDSFDIELHDMGFAGAVLREIAAESGESVDAMVAASLQGLADLLGEMPPGSPRERLYTAISAKLGDIDRSGILRIRLAAAESTDAESLMNALMADSLDESQLRLEVTYQPDP